MNTMEEQQLFAACNYCKTLMMLIIVVFHGLGFWGIRDWYVTAPIDSFPIVELICKWMASFHIYTFVLVAGFLFYELRERCGKYGQFTSFVIKKTKRLLVPYISVSILWCLPIGWLFFRYSLSDVLKKYVLGLAPAQLWFLLMLFWIYIFAWILTRFISINKLYIATLLVVTLFIVGEFARQIIPNFFMFWRSVECLPIFWAGFLLGHYRRRISENHTVIFGFMHLLLFVTMQIINFNNYFVNSAFLLLLHVSGACFAFMSVLYIAKRAGAKLQKLFKPVISYGMPVYLFHQQIIYICLIFTQKLPLIAAVVINIVVAIFVSILIAKNLRKNEVSVYILGEGK